MEHDEAIKTMLKSSDFLHERETPIYLRQRRYPANHLVWVVALLVIGSAVFWSVIF